MTQVGDETDEVHALVPHPHLVPHPSLVPHPHLVPHPLLVPHTIGAPPLQHRPHLLELLKQSKGVRKKQLCDEIERATGRPPNPKLLTGLLRVREEEREGSSPF